MQMLYNSDNFAVVQIDLPTAGGEGDDTPTRGGYEIVDKFARKEIFIQGAIAERFKEGVLALIDGDPSEDEVDDFVAGFAELAQHPVVLH